MIKRFGLGKSEKLKSRKQIEYLFATGSSFNVFPVKVVYKFFTREEESAVKLGVTVSQRNFKRAVDRNKIKRLLREGYRLQKTEFLDLLRTNKMSAKIFFIYTDKNISSFWILFDAITECLKQLQRKALEANERVV
jgi:ribonuclease P protein component